MKHLIKSLESYVAAVVPMGVVVLTVTAALKLLSPLAPKLGFVERGIADHNPPSVLVVTAIVELAIVALLCRRGHDLGRKLRVLFLFASSLLAYRVFVLGGLFTQQCSCLGAFTTALKRVGIGIEALLVFFLIATVLAYPAHLLREYLAEREQALAGPVQPQPS